MIIINQDKTEIFNFEEIFRLYVLEKDIDYIFKTYDVEKIEHAGLFFERSK